MSAAWLVLLQLASFAPPRAVDHVVHLEIVEGHGASSGDRSIVYRSGSLIRTDWTSNGSSTASSYLDLAHGFDVSAARDQDGVVQSVTIGRPFERPRRLPPTGRRDRALGENCMIWRLTDERMGSNTEICETADGILLWQAFWYPRSADRTVMYTRATAVERRPVRAEELLPPRNLLALVLEAPPTEAPVTEPKPDYEVEMAGDDSEDGSYVLRRHGRFYSNARRTPRERSLRFANGAVSLHYKEDDAGRPHSLEITRLGFSRSSQLVSIVTRWEPVAGRAPEQLLGETCTWQDDAAIESTDRHYYCRTADGITLKTESWFHWTGRTQRFTARRLSRGPLRDEDFTLPAQALLWAHWGIRPAP